MNDKYSVPLYEAFREGNQRCRAFSIASRYCSPSVVRLSDRSRAALCGEDGPEPLRAPSSVRSERGLEAAYGCFSSMSSSSHTRNGEKDGQETSGITFPREAEAACAWYSGGCSSSDVMLFGWARGSTVGGSGSHGTAAFIRARNVLEVASNERNKSRSETAVARSPRKEPVHP